ncbi:Uncharacterised protein [Mycobacteroides abscessus subsp. abscessus]|nr:Uncharacterised protein [Mycobacteroides abscessus subsp. abscessus]
MQADPKVQEVYLGTAAAIGTELEDAVAASATTEEAGDAGTR